MNEARKIIYDQGIALGYSPSEAGHAADKFVRIALATISGEVTHSDDCEVTTAEAGRLPYPPDCNCGAEEIEDFVWIDD